MSRLCLIFFPVFKRSSAWVDENVGSAHFKKHKFEKKKNIIPQIFDFTTTDSHDNVHESLS
jgi:hypothetical protein